MNLRPVIERELRVSARQFATYYSRLLPAAILLFIGSVMYVNMNRYNSPSQVGGLMFGVLNMILVGLIWVIIPLSTADVISREKREDTLGLLLLTPLRPFEVVTSKMMGGLLRGIALVLAVLPVQAVPFLLGGITGLDLIRVAILDLSALIGAVGAGVFISAFCIRRGRAWFMSVVMAAVFTAIISSAHLLYVVYGNFNIPAIDNLRGDIMQYYWLIPVAGWLLSAGLPDAWQATGFDSTPKNVVIAGLVFLTTLGLVGLALLIAARRVRTFAEHGQLTARQKKVADVFTRERLFARWLKARRGRLLTRNPSAWLVTRKWTSRLAKSGWLALVVGVLTAAVTGSLRATYYYAPFQDVLLACIWLGAFIVGTVLLLSATSLQSERDSGALELLLVTQLSPKQIVRGRLLGIWNTFQMAVILLAGIFLYIGWVEVGFGAFRSRSVHWQDWLPFLLVTGFFFSMLIWLPVIGLCFSLNRRGVLSACINTFFFGAMIPWLGPLLIFGFGVFLHEGVHGEMSDGRLFWTMFFVLIGVLLGLQIGVWVASRTGKLDEYPAVLPCWITRWKLGWIGPWALVGASLGIVEFLHEFGFWISNEDMWLVLLWFVVSVSTLLTLSRQCRKSLLKQLESRTFVTS